MCGFWVVTQATCVFMLYFDLYFLMENRRILRTHDDTVTLPWTEQNSARSCGRTRFALGTAMPGTSCSPELAAAVRIAAYGRISGRWGGRRGAGNAH